jgi:hypothetical protein
VSWAVNHAFPNETVPDRAELVSRFPDEPGNFPGSMDALTQFGQCTHVFAFGWRDSIEAHSKELLIELFQCQPACFTRHFDVNPFFWRQVPGAIPPFLQEIRVPSRLLVNFLEGVAGD